MSGLITDLAIRVCPSCTALFVQDDRMYEDSAICPRCGSDLAAAPREGAGGTARTPLSRARVMATEDGVGLKDQDGFGLRVTPTSRWG